MSTVYYALFHCLARCCADTLIGSGRPLRNSDAWIRTYRALSHGRAREACRQSKEMTGFPAEIQNFAQLFIDLQKERVNADYDPSSTFFKTDIEIRIRSARRTAAQFESTKIADRRAFAVHVLFKERP